MSFVPGMGILKGMALTMRRFFAPKVTIRYPEVPVNIAVKNRGRLQLLYDEHGTLKCETCFQCAQACPIECIDMGGRDTKDRYAVHWGASETYGERREEAALRRSGREVPDPTYTSFEAVDTAAVDRILEDHDYDPHRMLSILEAIQAEFGHLPVAALKQVSFTTGSWYALIYGTATYYSHLRFEKTVQQVSVCRCTACLVQGGGRTGGRALRGPPDGTWPGHAGRPDPARLAGHAHRRRTGAARGAERRAAAGESRRQTPPPGPRRSPGSTRPSEPSTEPMTNLLQTPAAWPRPLLGEAPVPRSRRPRRRCPGRRVRRADPGAQRRRLRGADPGAPRPGSRAHDRDARPSPACVGGVVPASRRPRSGAPWPARRTASSATPWRTATRPTRPGARTATS